MYVAMQTLWHITRSCLTIPFVEICKLAQFVFDGGQNQGPNWGTMRSVQVCAVQKHPNKLWRVFAREEIVSN